MDKKPQSVLRAHTVAKRQGIEKGTERAGAKARAYLNARSVCAELGIATENAHNVCHCKKCGTPHLHVFGSVIPITFYATAHDIAQAAALGLTFQHRGSHIVFKPRTKGYKVRQYERARSSVNKFHTIVHNLHRKREILESPYTSTRSKKRAIRELLEMFGIDESQKIPKGPAIWKTARSKRSQEK